MNPTCYEAPVLADYLAGRAAVNLARQVESHLRTCRRCQQALVRSSPPADSLLEAVRATRSVDRAEKEPELALALGAIRHLHTGSTPGGSSELSSADTGRLISNYELQKKLGEGGMGAVYLARHLRLKKSVAIKLLKGERSQDDSAIARFQVEIEAVGKLEHPHIVRALDAGEDRGTHFLVMEYLAGIDVARLVRGLGPMGLPEACELVRQAALGLHHAHENDVIHRDVKPSNLMLLAGGKVKVLDLGLAHFRPDWGQSHGLTRADQMLGTLLYVAPEQLSPGGKVEARTDVYSLGVTLAEILLGRVPCRSGYSVLLGDEERAARPDVPPDIWQLIARMTNLDPQARPGSMLTVAETLRPWCAGANLGRLLERLAGQTTFADPTLPAGGFAAAAASHGPPPGGIYDDPNWTEVVPPPIVSVVQAPVETIDSRASNDPEHALLPRRQSESLTGKLLWLTSGSVLALLAALAIWKLRLDPPDPPAPHPGVPPAETVLYGTAEMDFGSSIYDGLFRGIASKAGFVAVPDGGGEGIPLRDSEKKLPTGKYVLQGNRGIDWEVLPNQSFTVLADEPTRIRPEVVIPSWKHSRIPEPGQQVEYRGWLESAGTGSKSYFRLTLTALGSPPAGANAKPGGTPPQWLKIDVTPDLRMDRGTGDYWETGYLLVDAQAYNDNQRLTILDGWIEAGSGPIEDALAREFRDPATRPSSLVVKFDLSSFRQLEEPASRLHVRLPPDRIGIHTPLSLLFGAKCATPLPLSRAHFPAPTRIDLEGMLVENVFRDVLIVEAKSETEKFDVTVRRSEAVPFSFVQIDLKSELLSAFLKIESHTGPDALLAVADVPLDRLALDNQRIFELSVERSPLDVATLPDDGQGVRYDGKLTIPMATDHSAPSSLELTYSAKLRMLGSESIDDRMHRWLAVEVVTTFADRVHREQAVLLIDEERFRRQGELSIARGWFETDKHWLPLSSDMAHPIETIEEELCLLGAPLPAIRLGFHDVLALISKTSFDSTLGKVRAEFADWRGKNDGVTADPTHDPNYEYGTAGEKVAADIYILGERTSSPYYRIVRSHDMPFDFVEVLIITPGGIALTALAADKFAADPAEPPMFSLPTAELWEARQEEHRAAMKVARLAQPNWRLWNLRTPEGRVVRQWAEYGGQARGTGEFLLRDALGEIRKLPQRALDDEDDRRAIDEGRWWHNTTGEPFLRGELVSWKGDNMIMERSDGKLPREQTLLLNRFHKEDRSLLQELAKIVPTTEAVQNSQIGRKGRGSR